MTRVSAGEGAKGPKGSRALPAGTSRRDADRGFAREQHASWRSYAACPWPRDCTDGFPTCFFTAATSPVEQESEDQLMSARAPSTDDVAAQARAAFSGIIPASWGILHVAFHLIVGPFMTSGPASDLGPRPCWLPGLLALTALLPHGWHVHGAVRDHALGAVVSLQEG